MSKRSFICNACECNNDEQYCSECNGQGTNWEPINKELWKKDPHKFIEYLILASS